MIMCPCCCLQHAAIIIVELGKCNFNVPPLKADPQILREFFRVRLHLRFLLGQKVGRVFVQGGGWTLAVMARQQPVC